MCIRDRSKSELTNILSDIINHQQQDPKISLIIKKLTDNNANINQYYCTHNQVVFTRHNKGDERWKVVIPKALEKDLTIDYHIRYGHMGAVKVIKALQEHVHFKNMSKKVRKYIQSCNICQLAKYSNEKREGVMIPITSTARLEKVFLDICGPFPRSGGRHQYKYIIIIFDHYTKYTKLYPLNRATTSKILEIVMNKYIPEVGKPSMIITDHGTQFRGRKWRETLIHLGVKTYKTSVYHPNSNPAERVLREVGRILRTYCHSQQRKWEEYLSPAEDFLNLAYHQSTNETPYMAMYEKKPPREITEIINFPISAEFKFDKTRFYNNAVELSLIHI